MNEIAVSPSAPALSHAELSLDTPDLALVLRILDEHLPGIEVWAFGSRVAGAAKRYSDLDLALISPLTLSLAVMAELTDAFQNSDLPMRVDLVDWAAADGAFRDIIAGCKVVIRPMQGQPAKPGF